jgi:membrane fusion protein, multidrug efflux system
MIKRMILMLLVVGVVLGGVFGFEAFRSRMIKNFMASMGAPPQTVSTMAAAAEEWQPRLEAVGSLRAVNGADLALETPGIVDEIDFKSGDDVAAGTVLLRLRATDDIAKLNALQATTDLAALTYERDQKQFKVQAVSQATLDTDAANLKNAKAQAAQQQAIIEQKTLRAPFAGHLGVRAVDLGQFLAAGTAIVTLQALDPIYVDFWLPQQSLAQIKTGMPVTARVDTFAGETFAGEIQAISPKVDVNIRNVQVRAVIKNPDHKLLPGMFATIAIATGTPQSFVTLPQTAIAYNAYGSTVYVVEEQGKDAKGAPQLVAHQTFVKTGDTRGDQVAVLSGVKAGDTIVTAGLNKLHNGSPLTVNNEIKPTADANPVPIDR